MPGLERLLREMQGQALQGAARAFDTALAEVYERLTGERPKEGPAELVARLLHRDLLTPEAALHLTAAWTILRELRSHAGPATGARIGDPLVDMRRRVRTLVDTVFARN